MLVSADGERTVAQAPKERDRRRDPRRGREAARPELSLNPPDSSSAAMRASSGGWVSNAPLNSDPSPEVWFSGLSMNICATARGAWRVCCVSTWSFRSASARPSPSPVISAADASARYSRRRETASWIRKPATGARISAAMPRIERHDPEPPPLCRPPPQNATRSRTSETRAIRPTSTATRVISRTSRLRTCDISWASTPSSSRSSISCSRPVVTATYACFGLRPAANAFGAGSSIT